MDERKERCETCRFWDSTNSKTCEVVDANPACTETCGWCKRYPPSRFTTQFSEWPLTTETDWCGEWQSVDAEAKPKTDGTPFPWNEVKHPYGNKIKRALNSVFKSRVGERRGWEEIGCKRFPITFEEMIAAGQRSFFELRNCGEVTISALDEVMDRYGYGSRWKQW